MNSGFSVVVVVVAISKMMLIVVVVILFLGEELPLSCFRFVYLQFSVKLLLLLLLFGSVFLLFLRLPAFHRLLRLDGASVGDDW